MIKTIVIFFSLCNLVFAGEYVCFSPTNGYITERYYSVDGNHPSASRSDCINISRRKFNSLQSDNKVDPSVVGPDNDAKIVKKSAEEIKAEQDEAQAKQVVRDNLISSIRTKFKLLGFTDEETAYILFPNM